MFFRLEIIYHVWIKLERGGEVSLILSENSDYEPFILSLSQSTGASVLKISQQREPLRLSRNMQGQRVDCSWQRLSPAFVSKGMLWRRWSEAGTQMWLMASWQILRTGAQPDHKGAPPTSIIAHHKTLLKTSSGVCSMFARCSHYLFIEQQYKMHYTFQGSCLCSSSVKNVGKVIYCYGDLLPRNNGLLSQSKSSESGTGKSSSKDLIVAQLGVWVLGLLAL